MIRVSTVTRLRCGWRLFLFAVLLVPVAVRADPGKLLTEKGLSETLNRPVGFEISGDSRREALRMISKQFGVTIFLDRRIDPDIPLSYRTRGTPLGTALAEIAAQFGAAVTWLGPVGYVGPFEEVKKLQTVRALVQDQIKNMPSEVESRLSQPFPISWNRLATPEEIIRKITQNYELQWQHPDRLPHDLWVSGRLPPMDCATQCTIVLAGFGAMPLFESTGQSFAIVPIGQAPSLRRSYPIATDKQARLIQQWKQKFPHAMVKRDGSQLIFSGRAEAHWQLDPSSRPSDMPERSTGDMSAGGTQVYTLRVEAPLEAILAAIASQTELTIQWQRQAIEADAINLQRVVVLDVREVSLDRLLADLLRPNGLDFARSGQQITVMPAQK